MIIALGQLGREYRLNKKILCSYFNIKIDSRGAVKFKTTLNYFSICALLFYIKDILQYNTIRESLKTHIKERFVLSEKEDWKNNTELILLLLDMIACPFLDEKINDHIKAKYKKATTEKSKRRYKKEMLDEKYKYKKDLLYLFGITENHIPLIQYEKFWFIKWTDFDFGMELQAKRSQDVY